MEILLRENQQHVLLFWSHAVLSSDLSSLQRGDLWAQRCEDSWPLLDIPHWELLKDTAYWSKHTGHLPPPFVLFPGLTQICGHHLGPGGSVICAVPGRSPPFSHLVCPPKQLEKGMPPGRSWGILVGFGRSLWDFREGGGFTGGRAEVDWVPGGPPSEGCWDPH